MTSIVDEVVITGKNKSVASIMVVSLCLSQTDSAYIWRWEAMGKKIVGGHHEFNV